MSQRLPRVTADQAIRVIQQFGFVQVRQSGSHKIFRNAKGVRLTIPHHARKTLHPKLIKAVLRDAGLFPDDL